MLKKVFLLFQILLTVMLTGAMAGVGATVSDLTSKGSTEIPFDFGPGTFASWSGGALLVVERRFSETPGFLAFDRNGKQVSKFTFSVPGAHLINIYDHNFARGSDGSLVVAGSAFSDDSRGAAFLAWVSPDGRDQTVIRTSPFYPCAVAVASDGTIWVAGYDLSRDMDPDYNQHLIRHYGKSGNLLGSYIPWSSMGTDFHLGPPSAHTFLVASKDRIGWYSPVAHTYIEFSQGGVVINQYKTPDIPRIDLISVALCDDAGFFASSRILTGGHQTGWGIYALDRQRGEWNFIPRNERQGRLYGCEGTSLASTTNSSTILWLEPARK